MSTRELPGWSKAVPADLPDARIVECGGCGQSMSWQEFVHGHLLECEGQDDGD